MSGLELPHGPVLFLSLFGSVTPQGTVKPRRVEPPGPGWSGIVLPPGRVGSGLDFGQFGPAARCRRVVESRDPYRRQVEKRRVWNRFAARARPSSFV